MILTMKVVSKSVKTIYIWLLLIDPIHTVAVRIACPTGLKGKVTFFYQGGYITGVNSTVATNKAGEVYGFPMDRSLSSIALDTYFVAYYAQQIQINSSLVLTVVHRYTLHLYLLSCIAIALTCTYCRASLYPSLVLPIVHRYTPHLYLLSCIAVLST